MNAPAPQLRPADAAPRQAGGGSVAVAEDLIDFTRLFATLWRGRLVLAAASLAAAGLAVAWALTIASPRYQATAVLVMDPVGPNTSAALVGVVPGFGSGSAEANTQVEILKSRVLLDRLVTALNLEATAEFNPTLVPPEPVSGVATRLRLWLGLPHPPAAPTRAVAVTRLSERLAVRNVPDSWVFEITAESTDPVRAADIANGLARVYLDGQVALKQDEAARSATWLTNRVADLRAELEQAEARAMAFAESAQLTDRASLQALSSEVEGLRQELAVRRAELTARGLGADGIDAQLAPLVAAEAEMSERLAVQSRARLRFDQLRLEADSSRAIYEIFLARLKEAEVQRGIETAESRMLSRAEPPYAPARPRPMLLALLGGFLGAIGASVWLISRAARREVVETAEDLSQVTGEAPLAALPQMAGLGRRDPARAMDRAPTGRIAMAAHQLRAGLHLAGGTRPRVVMVTSALPRDGTSSVARALTKSLGMAGLRVLFIDAGLDPTDPRQMARPAPLLATLAGKAPLGRAIRKDPRLCADRLDGGLPTLIAGRILTSGKLGGVLRAARAQYDCIVLDAPPLLAEPDTRDVARSADALICVARAGRTRRTDLDALRRALAVSGLRVTGWVLNAAARHDRAGISVALTSGTPRIGRGRQGLPDLSPLLRLPTLRR